MTTVIRNAWRWLLADVMAVEEREAAGVMLPSEEREMRDTCVTCGQTIQHDDSLVWRMGGRQAWHRDCHRRRTAAKRLITAQGGTN